MISNYYVDLASVGQSSKHIHEYVTGHILFPIYKYNNIIHDRFILTNVLCDFVQFSKNHYSNSACACYHVFFLHHHDNIDSTLPHIYSARLSIRHCI